jgi:hypothetical protein
MAQTPMHRLISKWLEDPKGLNEWLIGHSGSLIEEERQLFIHAFSTGRLLENMDPEQYFLDTYGQKDE